MVDYLDQKMEHKQACETPSSTSSTTESGQIEDVEIINAEDEEDEENEEESIAHSSDENLIEHVEDIDNEQTALNDEDPKEDLKDTDQNEEKEQLSELANSLTNLSEEQKDEIFTEEQRQSAITNLIIFSALLFTVPVLLMYSSYRFIFKDEYRMSDSDAALYGGIIGVFSVYIIVCGFIWIAYREEQELERRYKIVKSQ